MATSYSYQRQLIDGVVAALDRIDLVAALLQTQHDHLAQAGIVFGNKYSHRQKL